MNTSMRNHRTDVSKNAMTSPTMTKLLRRTLLGGACLALVGLGTGMGASNGATAQTSQHAWPFTAPHAAAPTVENPGGGPVLASPRIVPVLFGSDPLLPDLKAFYAKLGTSTYLSAGLAEYGVGKPTILAPVIRSDTPPFQTDDLSVGAWIVDEIAAGALPPEDGNTVYSLVFPDPTTVLAWNAQYQLCYAINEATYAADGTLLPFTLSARCGFTDIDVEVPNQAFALGSALVDPGWWNAPGYASISWSGSAFNVFSGTWPQSLCFPFLDQPPYVTPPDLGYAVPHIWSNRAALESHDPCGITPPGQIYFNAAPDLKGTSVPLLYEMVKGIVLPPGGEVKIPVRLFSDGPTAPWTLGAIERTDILADADNLLSFSFDETTGRNGDVRELTVKRAVAPDGSVAENLAFEITSTLGTTVHEWIVVVGTN